jgi:histidyl-tRNA synthetase
VERLLALWKDQGNEHQKPAPDVYVVHQGEAAGRHAFRTAELLRDAGFAVHLHCGGGSFKSQMKKADGSGATLAAVIGDDEAAANEVSLKPLRLTEEQRADEGNAQRRVSLDHVAEAAAEWIFGSEE